MKIKGEVIVHTDGSCDNKKKHLGGGVGVYMSYKGKEKRISRYFPECDQMSSARMEVMGLLVALENIKPGFKYNIHCDNKYVVDTISKGWIYKWNLKGPFPESRAHSDIWVKILNRIDFLGKENVSLIWVKGHSGIEGNEIVDKLAGGARIGGR